MIELGKQQELKVKDKIDEGGYLLTDEDGNTVVLPIRHVTKGLKTGEEVSVFVYKDGNDRITATFLKPKIKLNEIALLEVKELTNHGAYLEWGMDKDLLVPFKEMYEEFETGHAYLVCMYLDKVTNRLVASAKLDRFLDQEPHDYKRKDQVSVQIWDPTDLGYKVVINGKHEGLIYYNEIFKNVQYGDELTGYIKKVRDDGKIDVSLQQLGYQKIEPNADKIYELMDSRGGYLDLHDKSDPDEIKRRLNMSKKTFKKAIGNLYKKDVITIEDDGIYLT